MMNLMNYLIDEEDDDVVNQQCEEDHRLATLPEVSRKEFTKHIVNKLEPGSTLLPYKYLNITPEEWQQISIIKDEQRMEQLKKLQEIKDKLWGKR